MSKKNETQSYPCIKKIKLSEIKGAEYNPRKISNEALGRLTKSLAELGDLQPITVNVRTGNTIIGGHQRFKIYQAMGREEIDVWLVDLSEEKEKAANLALNNLAGEFDTEALKNLIEEIDSSEMDLQITGFSDEYLKNLMSATIPDGPMSLDPESSQSGSVEASASDYIPPASSIRMVPIYLTNEEHDAFLEKVRKISDAWKTETATDTIKACVEKAYEALSK
jgi:hypothetical protein